MCDSIITFQNLKVAVLGLSFKPGTDDVREAPSVENIQQVLEKGAAIYAYDPVAEENSKRKFPEGANGKGNMTYVSTPQEALEEANICFIFTEWKEIRELKESEYKKLMQTPLVYDGRNIYRPSDMAEAGVEYYSIGR